MSERRREAGFSLVEMTVGLAIAAIVMTAVVQIMLQITNMNMASRMQNQVNDNYLLGLRLASDPAIFAARGVRNNPLGITAALSACLAQKGRGCNALPEAQAPFQKVPDAADKLLNASFSYNGTCQPTDAGCLVTRTTEYKWDCPTDTYCTGLRLNLKATPLAQSRGPDRTPIRERAGTILIPARQFVSKAEVSFTCPRGATNRSIFGIDYVHLTDEGNCGDYNPGVVCVMPMTTYVDGSGCVPTQQSRCDQGYLRSGLFTAQTRCSPAFGAAGDAAAASVPDPSVTGSPEVGESPSSSSYAAVASTPPGSGAGSARGMWMNRKVNVGPVGPCPDVDFRAPCTEIGRACFVQAQAANDIAQWGQAVECYDVSGPGQG